ncbi:MAG: 50S ribosomal protein L19e [Nanohaloarchaea archaeon]|nr:50S ribosomal protein L19e [Candidatus Nanohaloarchaea archaeon]
MNTRQQKELAARMLKVGKDRVWLSPDNAEDISSAITRHDIRTLVDKGVIKVSPLTGQSRVRARKIAEQKKKSLRSGFGSRKGTAKTRSNPKSQWMKKIRSLRVELLKLKAKEIILSTEYTKLYRLSTSGFFRNKSHLNLYIKKLKE